MFAPLPLKGVPGIDEFDVDEEPVRAIRLKVREARELGGFAVADDDPSAGFFRKEFQFIVACRAGARVGIAEDNRAPAPERHAGPPIVKIHSDGRVHIRKSVRVVHGLDVAEAAQYHVDGVIRGDFRVELGQQIRLGLARMEIARRNGRVRRREADARLQVVGDPPEGREDARRVVGLRPRALCADQGA